MVLRPLLVAALVLVGSAAVAHAAVRHGGPGPDRVRGTGAADRLFGLGGNDTLIAGSGADRVHGGTGNDTVLAAAGADAIDGGDGDDRLVGGAGDDRIEESGFATTASSAATATT